MIRFAQLKLPGTLVKNTAWMLGAEGASRASRLLTLVALATYLSSSEYGIVALALASHEVFRVLVRVGAGAKVIQCSDVDLPGYAMNGALLQWFIYSIILALQFVFAPLIASFYQQPLLTPLLQTMAVSYLLYPIVSLRVFMLQRSNNMRFFSLGNAGSTLAENISTVAFLVAQQGIMSIAYAKIVSALIWVIVFLQAPRYVAAFQFHLPTLITLVSFSCKLLGTETLRIARTQMDIFIAGRLLPAEIFGIYSFIKSAGLGLGLSLSSAYLSVLYPFICNQKRIADGIFDETKIFKITASVASIFFIQAVAALIYIDWFFPSQWHQYASLAALLCLSAIPGLLIETECCLLRANNQPGTESLLMAACVLINAIVIYFGAPLSATEMTLCMVASSAIWPLVFFLRREINKTHKEISILLNN